jgi:quercetin dioxygenase-like cupin family protein
MATDVHRPQTGTLRWRGVELLEYKRAGTAPFRDVTRQTLFDDPTLRCQLRYFEIAAGGHTTLERHLHAHAVVIQHGRGRALVGDRVLDVAAHDLVHVAPSTWHQFKAAPDAPLGFLCMVNAERDRPELPSAADLARMRENPLLAQFIAV